MKLLLIIVVLSAALLTGCFGGSSTTSPPPASEPVVAAEPVGPVSEPPAVVAPAVADAPMTHNPDIEAAKQALYRAEQNPTVATQLALDLERARAPLNEAEAIWKRENGELKAEDEEWAHIRHLAYIARQRAAIAEAKARSLNVQRNQPAPSTYTPDRRSGLPQPTVAYLPPAAPIIRTPSAPVTPRQAPEPYTPPTRKDFATDFQSVPLPARAPVDVVEFNSPSDMASVSKAPAKTSAPVSVAQSSAVPSKPVPASPLIQVYPPPAAQPKAAAPEPIQAATAKPAPQPAAVASRPAPLPPLVQIYPPPAAPTKAAAPEPVQVAAATKPAPQPAAVVPRPAPLPPLVQVYPPPATQVKPSAPVPAPARTPVVSSQAPVQVAAAAPSRTETARAEIEEAVKPVPKRPALPPLGPATAAPADIPASLGSFAPYSDRRGVVLTIGDEYFVASGTLLRPNSNSLMDNLVQYISSHPDQKVICEGYSDVSPLGGDAQIFAEGRARSIQTALFARGVDFNRVRIVGYGETRGRANRRVDVILQKGSV